MSCFKLDIVNEFGKALYDCYKTYSRKFIDGFCNGATFIPNLSYGIMFF